MTAPSPETGRAVPEHAVLEVPPERAADFEAAFDRAIRVIAAAEGCRRVSLSRCLEAPGRRLLHHFYDPFPTVEHFTEIASA